MIPVNALSSVRSRFPGPGPAGLVAAYQQGHAAHVLAQMNEPGSAWPAVGARHPAGLEPLGIGLLAGHEHRPTGAGRAHLVWLERIPRLAAEHIRRVVRKLILPRGLNWQGALACQFIQTNILPFWQARFVARPQESPTIAYAKLQCNIEREACPDRLERRGEPAAAGKWQLLKQPVAHLVYLNSIRTRHGVRVPAKNAFSGSQIDGSSQV
jgi:hypothetical protein